jgi:hypothetical protein
MTEREARLEVAIRVLRNALKEALGEWQALAVKTPSSWYLERWGQLNLLANGKTQTEIDEAP